MRPRLRLLLCSKNDETIQGKLRLVFDEKPVFAGQLCLKLDTDDLTEHEKRIKRCENFDIDDDQDIFNFYQGFCDEIFEKMPSGFTESRAIVDPVFSEIMGDDGRAFVSEAGADGAWDMAWE